MNSDAIFGNAHNSVAVKAMRYKYTNSAYAKRTDNVKKYLLLI